MIVQALFFHNCNGLRLSKMKHINSGKNHISINDCNNVVISDIHISAPEQSPNTDGIDISQSKNVLIQNSLIATGIKLMLRFSVIIKYIILCFYLFLLLLISLLNIVGDDCIAINNGSSNINIVGITCGPGHGIR